MTQTIPSRRTLTRFHLDRLDEAGREGVEALLLADAEAMAEAERVEGELIDAFAAGALSRRDARAFAATLDRVPGRRRRLELARGLDRLAAGTPEADAGGAGGAGEPVRRSSWWGWWGWAPALAAAAAVLLLVVGGLRLVEESRSLSRQAGRLAALEAELDTERATLERRSAELEAKLAEGLEAAEVEAQLAAERQRTAELAERLDRLQRQAARPAPVTVSFVLSAAVRSAGAPPVLAIPREADSVRLQLDLGVEEPYPAFTATLTGHTTGGAGAPAWSRSGLAADPDLPEVVEVAVPASVLAPGRYELRLYGAAGEAGTADPAGESGGGDGELVGAFELQVAPR